MRIQQQQQAKTIYHNIIMGCLDHRAICTNKSAAHNVYYDILQELAFACCCC